MSRNIRTSPGQWSLRLGQQRIYLLDCGLAAVAALAVLYLAVTDWRIVADVALYQRYAVAFWQGAPRLQALPHEYPPLSLLIFSLTLFPNFHSFVLTFALWMTLCALAGYLLVARFATRQHALAYVGYLFVGIAPMLDSRYDIVPAILTLGAFFATQRQRYRLAYILIAIGALLKVYPLFLLPVIITAHWQTIAPDASQRQRVRQAIHDIGIELGLCLGIFVAGIGLTALINPLDALSALTFASKRPVQVESTWSLIFFALRLLHHHIDVIVSYGSYNWDGRLSNLIAALATPIMALGVIGVALRQFQRKVAFPQAFLAASCIILLTNKVFSPQYLIWVLPLVAVVEGIDLIWVLICVLTLFTLIFTPFGHVSNQYTMTHFTMIIAARAALLGYATYRLLFSNRQAQWAMQTDDDDLAPTLKRPITWSASFTNTRRPAPP